MRDNAQQSPMEHLRKDLHAIARDAEALLKATADVGNDRIQEVRARAEKTVRQAFDHLYEDRLPRRVRQAAQTTDSYIREHSWSAIGTAAGIGLIIGLLTRRR